MLEKKMRMGNVDEQYAAILALGELGVRSVGEAWEKVTARVWFITSSNRASEKTVKPIQVDDYNYDILGQSTQNP